MKVFCHPAEGFFCLARLVKVSDNVNETSSPIEQECLPLKNMGQTEYYFILEATFSQFTRLSRKLVR